MVDVDGDGERALRVPASITLHEDLLPVVTATLQEDAQHIGMAHRFHHEMSTTTPVTGEEDFSDQRDSR